jgi:putative endonuclease
VPRHLLFMNEYLYYIYIVANATRQLYTGVTDEVRDRVWQHKTKVDHGSFTSHWHECRLVYFERFGDIYAAIAREKQLKRWRREKKLWLIESMNPDWHDLSADWFKEPKAGGLMSPPSNRVNREGRGPIAEKRNARLKKRLTALRKATGAE